MNWVLRDGDDAVGTVQATLRPDRAAEVAWVVPTPERHHGEVVWRRSG
jgi:hypothetical protein